MTLHEIAGGKWVDSEEVGGKPGEYTYIPGDAYTAWTIVYGAVERKIEQLRLGEGVGFFCQGARARWRDTVENWPAVARHVGTGRSPQHCAECWVAIQVRCAGEAGGRLDGWAVGR